MCFIMSVLSMRHRLQIIASLPSREKSPHDPVGQVLHTLASSQGQNVSTAAATHIYIFPILLTLITHCEYG